MNFLNKLPGPLLVFLGACALSFGGLIVKSFEGANLWQILFWRSVFFSIVVLFFLLTTYKKNFFNSIYKIGLPGFFGGIVLSCGYAGYVFAMYNTTVANANFIIQTQTIFLAVFGYIFLKEKITILTITSIFLAFGPLLTLGTGFAISSDTILLYSQEFYNLILIGVPLGLLTTNILFINQYPDYTSDKKVGKNNLVVFLGKKNSRWIYGLNLLIATVSLFEIANRTTDKILYYLVPIVIINGLFLFFGLMKNYDKRTLVKYNIQTIYFHMLFSFIYMIILGSFQ